MIPVFDASTLIPFAAAHHLHLLEQLFDRAVVPREVWRETTIAGMPGAAEVRAAQWIEQQAPRSRAAIRRLPAALGPGERAAIVLARELRTVLVVDDNAAYTYAQAHRIRAVRSLTLLVRMKAGRIIPRATPILSDLRAHGLHLSDEIARAFLRAVSE